MSMQAPGLYDNQYSPNNVYGHALAILRRHRVQTDGTVLHLDIGCGYGRIAEPLTAELDLHYVGADADRDGLASLRSRNFEAHELWLGEEETTLEALQKLVGNRRLSSISILDTLEHLADANTVLRAISRLAAKHTAFVVISVPNVAHADIGFKLALGRWAYTEAGLLDHTHLRLFSAEGLNHVLNGAGLYAFDANDVRVTDSDQHFPASHPALAVGTQLHRYLLGLRQGVDSDGDVNQFVRICLPGPATAASHLRPTEAPRRPFLSIVMRTQGTRLHTLAEVFTALSGQTSIDFEVLVMGHRLTVERQIGVERTIEDMPAWFRERCRLILVDSGNRTRPLNVGFAAAQGNYISILDDDDIPFGHWVENFETLAEPAPGCILRSVVLRQQVMNVTVNGQQGVRCLTAPEKYYPSSFDFLHHLRYNQTPGLALAFPRGAFHDLGLRFDEALSTNEDWDYMMRVAAVVGVTSSDEVTATYRCWQQEECSRTQHSTEEWQRNYDRIIQKMECEPMLFPAGTPGRIRALMDADGRQPAEAMAKEMKAARRIGLIEEILVILGSHSFSLTGPLRLLANLLGRGQIDGRRLWLRGEDELEQLLVALRQSASWRLTAPLRRIYDVGSRRP